MFSPGLIENRWPYPVEELDVDLGTSPISLRVIWLGCGTVFTVSSTVISYPYYVKKTVPRVQDKFHHLDLNPRRVPR
jgi:hypothetical protein